MQHIGIVGGGIIGLSTAYYLREAGYAVTVFDQTVLADGCSYGNAGMIVPSHIVPLAQPGMIAKGLRWMLQPTSPFYVKPRLNADLIRWGWLFYKHSTNEHVQYSIPALRDISLLSKTMYQQLAQTMDFGWHERGLLMLYQTASAEHELQHEADLANQSGIEARMLDQKQVQALEPDAEVTVHGAVYYPGDAHVTPRRVMETLIADLKSKGVQFLENHRVEGFAMNGSRVTAIRAGGEQYPVDEVVIAGGAWSPEVVKSLQLNLPLQGGKGYSFLLKDQSPQVRVPAIMLEARATATPMGQDLRIAGTMEINGTDLSVNMKRVQGISQSIQRYYPGIRVDLPAREVVWKGLRPCSPDGLPYIGRIPAYQNVTLATGHGMMGLSLGPGTGKLVSEIITGQSLSMDVAAFRPSRFQ